MNRRLTRRQKSGKWITRDRSMLVKESACAKTLRGETALSGQEQKDPGERAWLK